MIFLNCYYVLFFIFLSIRSEEVSKKCVCGHVQSQNDCKNSGFCFWKNDVCILQSGQTYNEEDQNQNTCNSFAEEDCRVQQQCGFYLGQCIKFIDCILFKKDYCQQSSYRCVSDGQKCVEIQECNQYKTEMACANKNKNGQYCIWEQGMEKKCRDVTICQELPFYLSSHIMCKQGLDGCTVDEKNYGCINQKDSCTQYLYDFQCFESKYKNENCFWDSKNSKCVEKICENLHFSEDYICKSYLSECTSNGIHCIQRKQCSDVKNKQNCVTDAYGTKCIYHQNQCKIKSCDTALYQLQNYQQCQDYDNFLDCVTSENGGCKQRPKTCEGYVAQVDCYSLQQQDCIWYKNRCEKRQCYHASNLYSNTDCKQYGNCIGKLDGGCQETPDFCDKILQEQFCEFNYNQERCFWLDGKCQLFKCNQLKFPTYSNHQQCQKANLLCTYSSDLLSCVDYLCENISDIQLCQIDSNGTICRVNTGCIEKTCNSAPRYYETNQECEEWLSFCTVHVVVLQNQKKMNGCEDKKNDCEDSLQEQCYTTRSGINCKWDSSTQKCMNRNCIDANPSIYVTNNDCKLFKVMNGICIIGSSGFGCQQWPNNCNQLLSQQQCQLNLQDGTKCFWTGSLCKIKECSDAPKIEYTNNIECNTWFDNCIFNHNSGGCMNRPSSFTCTSSPNNSMYDTHQECQAWNPECTAISTILAMGCEQKKSNCQDYIRQINCKTNLSGQNCYWNDLDQKCYLDDSDIDCKYRIYGELTHEDCEKFLSKCTINSISRTCINLLDSCDYQFEQQCVITYSQQPCKWDLLNRKCKNVMCYENIVAQTEAECLHFRKYNQCQLKIQQNGTYGPGCESRPFSCDQITNQIICNLTLTLNNEKCYFFDSKCQIVQSNQCEAIKDSKSNQLCQLYNPYCVLQSSGIGCYSIYDCSDLSSKVCNSASMKYNQKCNYTDYCRSDNQCFSKQASLINCQNKKTALGQLCYYQENNCNQQQDSAYLEFYQYKSFQDRNKLCQNYSSNYRYDTNCQCCVIMTSCSEQQGGQQICNTSTADKKCGYNFSINTCESRQCQHISYSYYSVITDQICYDWKYDCVFDNTGCTEYTGDCTSIKLIYQCYQQSCFWQDGKCVNNVDCQMNTTAVTDRECLLVNAIYCRFNYTKGLGCSFYKCDDIYDSTICNSSNLVDGQNCYWINGQCKSKICSDYTILSDCENSYGYIQSVISKCYWCADSSQCSNHKYCSSSSMTSPNSHYDCYNINILQTIGFSMTQKCTIKKEYCFSYPYKDACVKSLDDVYCYWINNACTNICQAQNFSPSSTHQQCYNCRPYCMSDGSQGCQILNCSALESFVKCDVFKQKCFWDGSVCKNVGACSNYLSSSLCDNTKNSKGILCFWNNTQCIEKTCQNNPSVSLSQLECNNWLINCQYNSDNNKCVEDCTSASTSFITHDQCDLYYQNKSCTLKLDIIRCVDLPITCNSANQIQCYIDRDKNQCYFNTQLNQCVNLTCENLETSYQTHQKCNQKLHLCTINATLNGCQQLNDCSTYQIQEQCQIDNNNVECEWIKSQNKCTIKDCSTAQLINYTAYSCHLYFDDQCTVNKNLDGCEIGQTFCMNYNYQQCISDGQMNLNGVECFWNDKQVICQERLCENAPSTTQSDFECQIFYSTCQKKLGCRQIGCQDYYYSLDSDCASIFEDKHCVTNGYQCVQRKACEDINMIDGCTFDINLNPCVWINKKCYTKTCQTAQISLTKYEECNSYLPFCTVNQNGGCIKKQLCQDYQIKEACYTDSENVECIWDIYLKKCFSNQCIDFCGNGIVFSQDEQCDDGNYLPYDGCYKCKIQCPQGCNICNGNQCQECLKMGWLLIDGVCISNCGDGYAVGNEQCDDGNNIKFDGCYQCTFQCHQKCVDCFQGQCIQCQNGLIEDGPYCNNICGDGYFIPQIEQCDDGNLQNNDGCNNSCKVEDNWICLNEIDISVCAYAILPKITLTKITKTETSYQEFKLSFSEPVCLSEQSISEEQFLHLIFIEIINAKDQEYTIEIKSIIPITTQLADVNYKIVVNFKTNVYNPVLKVKVNSDNIENIQGNTLLSNEAKLEFRSIYKMSDEQYLIMTKTSMMSRIVLYIIFIISGISFLCGNLEILWNILDMFQQLSYMKFHNIEFPENLEYYFEIFSIGSFTPILNRLQIDQNLQYIFNFQAPVIIAKWKFEYYQINCYFLENFETLLLIIIFGFINFLISYLFYKLLIICKYENWQLNNEKGFILKIVKVIFFIQRFARKYYQYFIYSGLIRIFTSNFYDLTFASILQLANFNTDTTINTTISYLALITLIFNFIFLAYFYSYLSYKNAVANNLSVLVEGIKNQAHQGPKQYFVVLLIKKTLFIINLVLFQGLIGTQCLITAYISGIFSCYLYIYKPFENNLENIKIIITEVLIMLNAIIFSLYEILKLNQDRESAESLGWVNISGFTLILVFTLAIDIYQQLQKYSKLVIHKIKSCLITNQKKQSDTCIVFY
ncbi:unnamed protein product [Paramecium primaurelia]|uniref:Uncharacterized protein n=1 Tax=Paramecium primaurelia TaxID=5886 RepID=A0A8S1NEZ4_PARPR|nr:unnamed protein product [Paramecium primaurelia]